VSEALDELFKALREASDRYYTIDEHTWNQRIVLRKSTVQHVDMHCHKGEKRNSEQKFEILRPLTDLTQLKRRAEEQQEEEDQRRRQQEAEKRRKKDEEKRQAQRRHEEEKRALAAQRKAAKTGKAAPRYEEDHRGKGRQREHNADGRGGKPQQLQNALQATPQQQQRPSQQQHPQKTKKGNNDRAGNPHAEDAAPTEHTEPLMPTYLPPPWIPVVDPNTQKYYYWNQLTNDVSWTPPTPDQAQYQMEYAFAAQQHEAAMHYGYWQ